MYTDGSLVWSFHHLPSFTPTSAWRILENTAWSHLYRPILSTCVFLTYETCKLSITPFPTDILRGAPRLAAPRIDEADAPEAIEFFQTQNEEELGNRSLREGFAAPYLDNNFPPAGEKTGRPGDFPDSSRLMCSQSDDLIGISGVEIRQHTLGTKLSPPFSVWVDRFAG